jgi:serine/threonine protein kinase
VGRLEQPAARFYTASVADVLCHLHEACGVVYRDLKPENLLLDARGYLKLVDFGLAKRLRPPRSPSAAGVAGEPAPAEPARTICGTPEYLAPEMVRGDAYGFSVDWWCVRAPESQTETQHSPAQPHCSPAEPCSRKTVPRCPA